MTKNSTETENETTPQLMTLREVAALERCSERTVRRAIATGTLTAIRTGPGGRLIRVEQAALTAYRRACRPVETN